MQKILSLLRRCVEDYQMIAPGERVGVCLLYTSPSPRDS